MAAVSAEMAPCLQSSSRLWSIVRIPWSAPAKMAESIWWLFCSRIMFLMAGLTSIISKAGTSAPSRVGTSCWQTTACSTMDSCTRTCCWALAGKTSMMRSMVLAAPVVCRVEKSSCPVSAAVMATSMVS